MVIRLPGRPDKEINVAGADAGARHITYLKTSARSMAEKSPSVEANQPSDMDTPSSKKRKLDAVASSVVDRASGPGKDPTSRFAFFTLEDTIMVVLNPKNRGRQVGGLELRLHCLRQKFTAIPILQHVLSQIIQRLKTHIASCATKVF